VLNIANMVGDGIVWIRDLRISRLHSNWIPNRIGHYDSNSNWIDRNYTYPKASSTLATIVVRNSYYNGQKRRH